MNAITTINIIVTIGITLSSVIIFLSNLFLAPEICLPDQISTECQHCKSKNTKKYPHKQISETNTKTKIMINIIVLVASVVITIPTILGIIISDEEAINVMSFIETLSVIELNSLLAKWQGILLIANTIMYKLFAYTKENVIASICEDCGNIDTYYNT